MTQMTPIKVKCKDDFQGKMGKQEVKILALLDEYGVYWDRIDPKKPAALNFISRLRGNERLRKACFKLKDLNITIQLELKFEKKSEWIKVDVSASNEKITQFLTRTR